MSQSAARILTACCLLLWRSGEHIFYRHPVAIHDDAIRNVFPVLFSACWPTGFVITPDP